MHLGRSIHWLCLVPGDTWQQFLKDSGGTGFWHETYFMGGGVEAIYDDMAVPDCLSAWRLQQVS